MLACIQYLLPFTSLSQVQEGTIRLIISLLADRQAAEDCRLPAVHHPHACTKSILFSPTMPSPPLPVCSIVYSMWLHSFLPHTKREILFKALSDWIFRQLVSEGALTNQNKMSSVDRIHLSRGVVTWVAHSQWTVDCKRISVTFDQLAFSAKLTRVFLTY